MQYKTIVLHLLEQRPALYARLRRQRAVLEALDHYAAELRACHQRWTDRLSLSRPDSDESQISAEALELALADLQDSLPPESPAGATA